MNAFTQHNEWQDSLADWAEQQHFERERLAILHADYGSKDRSEHVYVELQGRREQGWPARRCSPEVQPHIVDRLRESYDREDQSDSADGVFWLYMAVIGAVIAAAIWAVWA